MLNPKAKLILIEQSPFVQHVCGQFSDFIIRMNSLLIGLKRQRKSKKPNFSRSSIKDILLKNTFYISIEKLFVADERGSLVRLYLIDQRFVMIAVNGGQVKIF